MSRNYYDDELKNEAVRRFYNGESSTAIAKDLKIHDSEIIRKWAQADRKKNGFPPGHRGPIQDLVESQTMILMRENQKLQEERDILAKSWAIGIEGSADGWRVLLSRIQAIISGTK